MAIQQKLQNIINEKTSQATMTNYGLSSEEQINSNTKFIDYPKYIFKAFIESLNNPNTLWGNLPKITGEGKEITLNNTIEAPMKLELNPNIEQGADPSPTNPQQIHTISGDNEIVVRNKNLINIENSEQGGIDASGQEASGNDLWRGNEYIKVKPNTQYTFSLNTSTLFRLYEYDNNKNFISPRTQDTATSKTITTTSNTKYLRWSLYKSGGLDRTYVNSLNIMLEQNPTATTYVEHKEQVKEINLGKNLLDISTIQRGYLGTNDGSYSNGGTSDITINGNVVEVTTTTTYRGCVSDYIEVEENTMYTPSYTPLNSNSYFTFLYFYNSSKTFISRIDTAQNINTPAGTKYIRVQFGMTTTGTFKITDIMLEKGTTPTEYAPYFTPIEYCEIGDYKDDFIRNSGKNLLDNTVWQNSYITSTGGINNSNQNVLFDYIKVEPNRTYIFNINKSLYNLAISEFDNSKTFIQRTQTSNVSNIPITTTSQTKYVRLQFNYDNSTTVTQTIINNLELMLNEGSTALPYEPYGKDQWYIKKNIGKTVLDGTEDWQIYGTGTANWFYYTTFSNIFKGGEIYSNNYPYTTIGGTDTNQGICTNGYLIRIRYGNEDLTDNYKAWLSTHNTSVYYPLSTPTYTLLNDTLQTQLEDIYNTMKSYNGQTLISQVNTDLAFNISSSAIEDIIG